jgi:hypothetical protein
MAVVAIDNRYQFITRYKYKIASLLRISHLHCLFGHLQGALLGFISPNEARRVHKNTTLDARDAGKLLVSDPAPRFR